MGQALRGEPLTVYGDGSQTRSFCFVSDLVDGIYRLLCADFHEPVNLGNPNEVSILDFAQEILALSGANCKIEHKPLPQDDPKVRCPTSRGRGRCSAGAKGGPQGGMKRRWTTSAGRWENDSSRVNHRHRQRHWRALAKCS